ncbi:MAG: hypothetical protein HON61_06375 [Alphaproteobacteria bacterium]|nr:hypothetical protein [Alphaproteobacteria bacterium]
MDEINFNSLYELLKISTFSLLTLVNIKYFVAAGGVASNKAIGKSLNELALRNNMEFVAPPIKFCTDNAAMIAWAGGLRLLNGQKDSLEISVKSRWPLNEMKINGGMHE